MNWENIAISYGIPIVSIILSLIVSLSKNAKVKKYASDILDITSEAKVFIIEAEAFTNYTGVEKKAYVMTRLLSYIVDNKIKKVSEEQLSEIVESEVALTNKVNVEKKTDSSSVTIVNEPTELPTSQQD